MMLSRPRPVPLAGWGRYPIVDCLLVEPESADDLARPLERGDAPAIARGSGRSYGDASLAPDCTIAMRRLDRLLAFDDDSGTLTCEGGALLADVVELFVPRGWFPPVTPGTRFVTIGGMIASDVHGKNHHVAGSFCEYVSWIDLALGDGSVLRCSRTEHADLFAATCGGMGLTGVIVCAAFSMIPIRSARMDQTNVRAANLGEAFDIFEASAASSYSVAWIDCLATGRRLGRSVVSLGEHAVPEQLPAGQRAAPFVRTQHRSKRLPFDFPALALNRFTVGAFNKLYYATHRPRRALVGLEAYFYPLDAIEQWNRLYGSRGFVQYQCVLPLEASREGLAQLLSAIARSGTASFLAVLKRLGRESFGYLSFPMPGYTLALDFPVREGTFRLLDALDDIVAAHGGRVYLAKDARTSARAVCAGYPRLDAFREVRERYGLLGRFASCQSKRLHL